MRWMPMRFVLAFLPAAAFSVIGCAHHSQGNYAYQPPYAPPVYPQPHSATQPVAYVAPAGTVVGGGMPSGAVVGAPVAAPVVSGVAGPVSPQGVPPCPPMPGATLVGSSDGGTVVGAAQSPPCPPGP